MGFGIVLREPIRDESGMRFLGLTPDQMPAPRRPLPGVGYSMGYGALCLGVVSVVAYSIWAFRLIPGTAAMYTATAAVYVGLGGWALGRLVTAPGTAARVAGLFALGFVAYAAVWCLFWFGLRGKHHADLYGALFGLGAMTWLVRRAFGRQGGMLEAWAVLFACHTLGYTLGDDAYALVRGTTGRLLWGAAHGVGFGLGLGYLLRDCQRPDPPATAG
jgi:hypothetical protein